MKMLTGAVFCCCLASSGLAAQFGIYLTEPTATKASRLKGLIDQAKAAGINTFVVDYEYVNSQFNSSIQQLHKNGIRYVARVTIFPGGANYAQMHDKAIREKRYRLIRAALAAGADEIQLDYIRYSAKTKMSSQNALDVYEVIKWFRDRIPVPIQIDIFGVAAHEPSRAIGQNVKLFASVVDGMCPMVYPSHYYPARAHAYIPYETIFKSLNLLQQQFAGHPPFRVIPYLEVTNFRVPMSDSVGADYIWKEIQAAKDANSSGYYFWSANNKYNRLFRVLRNKGRPW